MEAKTGGERVFAVSRKDVGDAHHEVGKYGQKIGRTRHEAQKRTMI